MEGNPTQVLSAFGEVGSRTASTHGAHDSRAGLLDRFRTRFESGLQEEYSLAEYLEICRNNPAAYATAAERMLMAIGEPESIDTRTDPRLSRIFSNKIVRVYPAFREFYGMEETIEQIVAYFKHSAQALEERKQIIYLLGPPGGGKSSLAEKLKALMEQTPFYALKDSPVNETPLGLFSAEHDGPAMEQEYGIPRRYLNPIPSPWAVKRLAEYGGDLSHFRVVKLRPSTLAQIGVCKTEPGDENNQDISSLVGKLDIRKLEQYSQDDADAYSAVRVGVVLRVLLELADVELASATRCPRLVARLGLAHADLRERGRTQLDHAEVREVAAVLGEALDRPWRGDRIEVAPRDAVFLLHRGAVVLGGEETERRLVHRRVLERVEGRLLHQRLELFGQRALFAAGRAEQIDDLLALLQRLRPVLEVGDDLFDRLLHAVTRGTQEYAHDLVGEDAREPRIGARVDALGFADRHDRARPGGGIVRQISRYSASEYSSSGRSNPVRPVEEAGARVVRAVRGCRSGTDLSKSQGLASGYLPCEPPRRPPGASERQRPTAGPDCSVLSIVTASSRGTTSDFQANIEVCDNLH